MRKFLKQQFKYCNNNSHSNAIATLQQGSVVRAAVNYTSRCRSNIYNNNSTATRFYSSPCSGTSDADNESDAQSVNQFNKDILSATLGTPLSQQQQQQEQKPVDAPTKPAAPRSARLRKQAFALTDTAAERIKYLMSKRPEAHGVKIGVTKRGCSGLSYSMDYVAQPVPKPAIGVNDKGVMIYIDPKAEMFVLGTTLDYVEDDVSAEFKFNNPNAKGTCGCGESFKV